MKIERHETGPRMSKAVIHGDTVYLAGIVADNPKGKSTAEQTRSILSQIDSFLATAGTNKTKLLSTNIWITDMANFAEMNAVSDAWCHLAIRQRGRPLRPNSRRQTTRLRSWWWRRASSVSPVQHVRKPKRAARSRLTTGKPVRNRRSAEQMLVELKSR